MQKHLKFLPYLICLCLIISLYLKYPASYVLNHSEQDKSAFILSLEVQNLSYRQTIKPVNRGQFDIQIFDHHFCEGLLAVIALERNEEGAGILAHYLNLPVSEIKFIFDNQVYDEFPAFSYWLANLTAKRHGNSVLAVKEYGHCNLIENTDWSQI
ncbi:hypothetical protein [Curvivirga sp.]|uniref:hypothetical protein n=1 Tax=Curvivirga sp. TaxID=2856848 RepID=UPI003B5C0AA7